jgi:flagellar export protein FliJ
MTRRFRLAGVLRARQAQEDVAKGAVVRARAETRVALERQAARERSLLDRPTVDGGPAPWWIAATSARAALAGELTAAGRLAEQAAERMAERTGELTDAAIRRRSVETLAERHQAAEQLEELASEQRALDEIPINRRSSGGTDT